MKWYRAREYYSGSKWRGTLALDGGGALINQGIHTVDLLVYLLGDVTRMSGKVVLVGYHQGGMREAESPGARPDEHRGPQASELLYGESDGVRA